jgi:hypothetical protein
MPREIKHRGVRVRRRLRPIVAVLALAASVAIAGPLSASATGTPITLVSGSFTGASVDSSSFISPTIPSGVNTACLTAGTDTTQTPIPGCGATPDPVGSGALRLTTTATSQVGAIGYAKAIPTEDGIDAQFDSYQYGGTANIEADGIGFYIAASDPLLNAVPSQTGYNGADLGYSPNGLFNSAGTALSGTTHVGLANAYLGVGLDAWGNYASPLADGSGCATPAPYTYFGAPSTHTNVTVRGPGSGLSGYCVLKSTYPTTTGFALSTPSTPHGRSDAKVPVEVAINTSNASAVSNAGISVPANSYLVAFTPIGGSQQTLTGPLPSTINGGIPAGTYPASWTNPLTGYPYKISFGWLASTGGKVDTHEVVLSGVKTLFGAVPVLTATSQASGGGATPTGSAGTFSITAVVDPSGTSETFPVTIVTTFPAGLTPQTPSSVPWGCAISGQVVTCVYTPSAAIAAGTQLPALALPYLASGSPSSQSIPYVVSSPDSIALAGVGSVTIANADPVLPLAPTLPITGVNVGPGLAVAAGLVSLGLVLLLAAFPWKRRRRFGS